MIPASLFVSDTAVTERDVKLPSGAVHKLYFRDISQKDFREFREGNQSKDELVREQASAKLVAVSLCEPDGTPAITVELALTLKPAALLAISNAILVVNDFTVGND